MKTVSATDTRSNEALAHECWAAVAKLKAALLAYKAWEREQTDDELLAAVEEVVQAERRAYHEASVAWCALESISNTTRLIVAANAYHARLSLTAPWWAS